MNINQILRKILNEATSDSSGSRGSYIGPLQPGVREFKKIDLQPFTMSVSKYNNAMLEYDSYDGSMSLPKKQINKLENKSKKISNYIKNHPNSTFSDEDGNVINQYPGKITESSTSISAGPYNGPQELGLRKWKKHILGPYTDEVDNYITKKHKEKTLKGNIKKIVGVWEKDPHTDSYEVDTYPVDTIKEDLSVWFGNKKKSKDSSEPQGPWVNICRNKKGGGHPPCGRPDADSKGYPKCRAAGVAAKMTDEQKKSACQQKRSAEKKDTQIGKGQKPIMTKYKPRTNENMKRKIITLTENDLMRIVKRVITEQKKPTGVINLFCQNDIKDDSFRENNLIFNSEEDKNGGINGGGYKRLYLSPSQSSTIPRETYDDDMFMLDIVPADILSQDFLDQTEFDDPNAKVYFLGIKHGLQYFCRVDSGSDPEWETYLNSL